MSFQLARTFGVAASIIILVGVLVSSLFYRGRAGERYSLLNHYISELGEVGVSRAAWVFNLGLILGGLLMVPFTIGLGMLLNSLWGWLGTVAGTIAVLGVAGVGFFPMNQLKAHTFTAMTYFRAGLFMTLFYGLAIFFQPLDAVKVPYILNVFTFLALAAYAAFLLDIRVVTKREHENNALDPQHAPARPRFWLLTTLEWMILISTILWLFAVAALT